MFEINKLNEEIDFNNLTYYYTSKSAPKYFVYFKGPLIIYNDLKNGRISLQKKNKSIRISIGAKLNIKRKSKL